MGCGNSTSTSTPSRKQSKQTDEQLALDRVSTVFEE